MPSLPKGQRHPDELRERAIRMVFEHAHEYPSQWKAIESIAEKLDIHRETLRLWVRRAEVDDGRRPGLTTDERARLKELEGEVKELRGPTRSSRRRRLSLGRSSTASPSADRVHRRASSAVRGRADLQGAHRARLQDRPEHLMGGQEARPVEASAARRGAHGRDPAGL